MRTLTIVALTLCSFLLAPTAFAQTNVGYLPITEDTIWTSDAGPYVVNGWVSVYPSVTLTIEPGTVIKFMPGGSLSVAGILRAEGTLLAPIYFTSFKDDLVAGDTNGDGLTTAQPGDWGQVYVGGTGVITLTHSVFRFGGAPQGGAVGNYGGTITVTACEFSSSLYSHILQRGGTTTVAATAFASVTTGITLREGALSVVDSSFGTTTTAIEVAPGSLYIAGNHFGGAQHAVWLGQTVSFVDDGGNTGAGDLFFSYATLLGETIIQGGLPSTISGYATIPPNASLTLLPGTVLKFDHNSHLSVSGTLTAASSSVTALSDDSVGGDTNQDGNATLPHPGDYCGIIFDEASQGILTHTSITYGGCGYWSGNTFYSFSALQNDGGTLTLSDVLLAKSNTNGLNQTAGASMITKSEITNNPRGVVVYGGNATIHLSKIHGNSQYGVENHGTTNRVDATQNWWGAPGGPTHPTNPFGAGDRVSDHVDFGQWLTVASQEACTPGTEGCHSNVLFLPGIMGSRLFETSSACEVFNSEEERWVSKSDCAQSRLALDANGKSVHQIYTKEGEDGVIDDAYSFNLYQSFMHDLEKWKNDERLIADYALVPYDWRLSLEDILQNGASTTGRLSYSTSQGFLNSYIYRKLAEMVASSRTGKVTIIAHSNGGLLTKALIQKLKDIHDPLYDKIDKIIFVAVPQTGTPEAVSNILHGDQVGPLGSIMSTKRLRNIAQNMPSAYHLLPLTHYFTSEGADIDTHVVSFEDGTTTRSFIAQYGHEIATPDNLKSFLLGADGRSMPKYSDVIHPSVLSPSLLSDAEDVQQKIGDSWSASPSTVIYQIAGWGIPTLARMHYRNVHTCVSSFKDVCLAYSDELTFDPKEVIDGDGTVVEPSALAMSTSSERVKRYWVDLPGYNNVFPSSIGHLDRVHKDILEVSNLRDFIKSIAKGNLAIPKFISNSTPHYNGSDTRLTFVLHSPLTLEFTDSLGNHIGPSTSTPDTIDNFVPGARYTRYGEVQVLSILKSATGTIMLRGTDSGSFTLDVEEVNGNDILSRTSFEGIPSSTSTIVSMEIDPLKSVTGSSTLIVDYDGDGATDFTLQSKQDSILTLPPSDLTPPTTIASTSGTLGTNNWFTSDVIITLSAMDTESGVASTTYSLDNGVTWVDYTNPFTVYSEGSTTLLFLSIDIFGNREATNTLTLFIDKTAPEAMISVSTFTQDLLVTGSDSLSRVVVTKESATTTILTDQAGHTTKLFFTKTYSGKRLTAAKLTGIQYDTNPRIVLPSSSFVYVWDPKNTTILLSQTIAVNNTYLIQAIYDKTRNKTTIIVLKKNVPIKTQSYIGLRIPQLTTNSGVVGYSL